MTFFAALAMLAAACSDPLEVGPADGGIALGPTVVASGDGGSTNVASEAGASTLPTTPPLPAPIPTPTMPPTDPVTVLAAGNLGDCQGSTPGVADAMADDSGVIVAAGDLSTNGTQTQLDECFVNDLGADLDRVIAVPGDHDLHTDNGAAFYELASQTSVSTSDGEGWFVTMLGEWQIIGLNSQCEAAGGCGIDSPQYRWLDAVLSGQPAQCRAAIWHDARFTSALGEPNATDMGALVGRLDGAGTDIVITGSPGNYERLGPLRPSGAATVGDENGIMHFNIGGGSSVGFDEDLETGSVARNSFFDGYVRLVLGSGSYTWEFVSTSVEFSTPDMGAGTC